MNFHSSFKASLKHHLLCGALLDPCQIVSKLPGSGVSLYHRQTRNKVKLFELIYKRTYCWLPNGREVGGLGEKGRRIDRYIDM